MPATSISIMNTLFHWPLVLILLTTTQIGSGFSGSALASHGSAIDRTPIPIVIDTDLGDAIDDAFALGLALACPELELLGVTTVQGDAYSRAMIACRFLYITGHAGVPVAAGGRSRQPQLDGQFQYAVRHVPRKSPVKLDAAEFLARQIQGRKGKVTVVALGPLTNVAALLRRHPDVKSSIERIILIGGSLNVGYNGQPPAVAEWNVKSDIGAAREVLASGVPLVVVPIDPCLPLKLDGQLRKRLFNQGSRIVDQIEALCDLADEKFMTLFDPVAVALAIDDRFGKFEDLQLSIDAAGITRRGVGRPNARVLTSLGQKEFTDWLITRLTCSKRITQKPFPLSNPATLVEPGRMPARIHAAEDYETEIERRRWPAGRLEMSNVPTGSRRACRAVLSNEFQDSLSDPAAMHKAVVFNPVPGPPMGPKTKISFRYFLRGSDKLRVQLYSLTRNYHRHLTLSGLPQGEWRSAAVDMTRARRPDGSGQPLAAGERVDDIQFYTERTAELLIDSIVLYEASEAQEIQPFPQRPIFTAWFDTGRQGREWPGAFEIVRVNDKPDGKAAQSVMNPSLRLPWIRLRLRDQRPLGQVTQLRFRYRLSGAGELTILLANSRTGRRHAVEPTNLKQGEWAELTVDFNRQAVKRPASPRPPLEGDLVDEIQFLVPRGAELQVDDVLLFEPGGSEHRQKP